MSSRGKRRHALRKGALDVETRSASTTELVTGLVTDVRDLLGAHVESVRGDVTKGLGEMKGVMTSAVIAAALSIIAAILTGGAVAATLVALGLAWWAALWIVAGAAGLATVIFAVIARRRSRKVDVIPDEALGRARDDAAWVAERAADVVTGH